MELLRRIAVIGVAWAFFGCAEAPEGEGGPAFQKEVNFPDGDSQMVVLLDKNEISLVESVQLELILRYPAGENFSLPSFKPKLGEWTVVDETVVDKAAIENGRIEARRSYTLEPYLPGEYVIPETPLKFEGVEGSVSIPEIPITVHSVLDGGAESAKSMELAPAFEDVDLPGALNKHVVWWLIGAGVVLGIAALGAVVYFRAQEQQMPEQPVESELLAAELTEILASDVISPSRLCSVAARSKRVPKELVGKIEALAFSEGEAGQNAVREVAAELQHVFGRKGEKV